MNERIPMQSPHVFQANLELAEHQEVVLDLLDLYASDPMGLGVPLPDETQVNVISGLREFPTSVVFLAEIDNTAVGLAICFRGFSTFAARPLLNIHDLVVHPDYRGCGIGSAMLSHIKRDSSQRGYCKVTLEVRHDNETAKSVYRKHGFNSGDPPYEFWTSSLGRS